MKRLLFILLSLVQLFSLAHGQGIRATSDTAAKPRTKTATPTTPATYTGRQIVIGRGGGFTGFTTSYYLLDNGKLFGRRSRDTTFTFIGKKTTAQTKRLFSNLENTCKIKKTKFDHPGNLYQFVQWRKGKTSYKVSWGMAGHTVTATYLKFVNSFMALIPASSQLK